MTGLGRNRFLRALQPVRLNVHKVLAIHSGAFGLIFTAGSVAGYWLRGKLY